MDLTTADVKRMILAEGVDQAAIADARVLILANPPQPATDLMPTARSVIVMLVAHSLGSVYAPDIRLWTRDSYVPFTRLRAGSTNSIGGCDSPRPERSGSKA